MWGWLTALIRGLADSFFGWYSAYSQGRNAEQAKSAQERADESAKLADAHARVRDVVVDDEWLHRRSPTSEATPSARTSGETGPRG